MSIIGIDLGSQNARIAVVRHGGVDILCNEVSDRLTPSLVSFTAKRRFAGDPSRTQMPGNLKNTISCIPRFIGKHFSDKDFVSQESKFSYCQLTDVGDSVSMKVEYLGEDHIFTNVEITAMFLSKLKTIAFNETKNPICDVVISVPSFFTEEQRLALMDASEIAGINCICTINEVTASAINYGMTKSDIPESSTKNVAIIDIGYSCMKSSIFSFSKSSAELKSHTFSQEISGREFDEVLVEHFKSCHPGLFTSSKSILRLRQACEKMKKILSTVSNTSIVIEVNGQDIQLKIDRSEFESLSSDLFSKFEASLKNLISESKFSLEEIDSVEIIGGSTRVSKIKELISQTFQKNVGTTLVADESVARGCAVQCALQSPLVRARNFKALDFTMTEVFLKRENNDCVLSIPKGTYFTKVDSISISPEFPLILKSSHSKDFGDFATFKIDSPKSFDPKSVSKCSISVCFDASGLIQIPSGTLEIKDTSDDIDENGVTVTKDIIRCIPLKIQKESFRLSSSELSNLKENEIKMSTNDDLVSQTDLARNSLEELMYESRSKINDKYSHFCSEDQINNLFSMLDNLESWVYEDGSDVAKDEYLSKIELINAKLSELDHLLPKEESKNDTANENDLD